MREKNKNNAKLVLIIALAAIAVFVIVIIIKLAAPAKIAAASEYVGQWIDKQHTNASLDLWDTDGTNLIGMSTWQIDSDNAAFEADKPVGVVITNVSGAEDLSIDLIYNTSSPAYMAGLLNQFVSAVEAADRMGNRIYFVAANEKIEAFLKYLTGDAESLLPSTLLKRGSLKV